MIPQLLIHGYRFQLGSFACPEAYDVFDYAGTQVAYVRVRNGYVKTHCPDYDYNLVYSSSIEGDGLFMENERLEHLTKSAIAIQEWIIKKIVIEPCQDEN